MFTFQPTTFFDLYDPDIADANIIGFVPVYASKKYHARYSSQLHPLCYTDHILIRSGDIVLHLIEEQGRMIGAEPARVWETLYYDNGLPIGIALVPQVSIGNDFSGFYTFTKIDSSTGQEKKYFRNHHTLNQQDINRRIALLARANHSAEIWMEQSGEIVPNIKLKNPVPYPKGELSDQAFRHSVIHQAKMGNPVCLFATALWFREQYNIKPAIHGFQKAAQKNFAPAWLELGLAYLNGDLLEPHPDKATACFRQAVQVGSPLANYYLALSHVDGIGIEQSDKQAIRHLKRAAEHGITAACLALGLYYLSGTFNHLRPRLSPYRRLSPSIARPHLAVSLFFQASSHHTMDAHIAEYYLAECYRTGNGVVLDKEYASELYQRAATQGDITREEIQSAAYYNGDVERLEEAANGNNAFAAYLLGRMHWFGEYAPKDIMKARRYLRQAAESGHSCAGEAEELLRSDNEYGWASSQFK